MFWVRFWSFLMGYLTITVEGHAVEKLVNMAVSRGIYLWDIKWLGPHKILLKARVSSFRALRHIVRKTGGRIRIKDKKGVPFTTARLLRRQMMVVGAIACIAILYVLSSFVWFIEVEGNKKVSSEVILAKAQGAGLFVGTAKWKLNAGEVERDIKNDLSELSWVGIDITGTKAIIRVAEKVVPKISDDTPANIVADKSGLVEEVLVLAGAAVTKEGAMVKKGDLLITGVITTEMDAPVQNTDEEKEQEPEKIIKKRFVRARGIVKARVWYEGYGEAELSSTKQVRTGRVTRSIQLKIGDSAIILQGRKAAPYKAFVAEQRVKRLPKWRNIKIPVEIVTTYYFETKEVTEKNTRVEARNAAVKLARARLNKVLPAKAKVQNEKLHIIRTGEANLVRVKIIIETSENIGAVKPIEQREIDQPFQNNQEVKLN